MIITWENAAQKAAGMSKLGDRVRDEYLFEWGDEVALKGEQTIRDVILSGGMNPTKKGGPRVKTGEMISAVDSETIASGGVANVFAGIGWNKPVPLHALFQEGGTSRGIPAMMAIPEAERKMENQIDKSGNDMMQKIQGRWNSL